MDDALIERLQQFGADLDAARRVNALAQPAVNMPAGALLARPGEPVGHVHLLSEGWTHRWRSLRDGRRQVVSFALSGEFCDLEAFRADERGANLSTFTACRIRRLPLHPLQQLLDADAGLRAAFLRLAHSKRLMAEELILSLGRRSAIERIAHLLCEMAVRLNGNPRSEAVSFPLPLTQTDLADITGLSFVHVNRSLQTLKRQLGVTIRERKVSVPSWAEMIALAEFDADYLVGRGVPDGTVVAPQRGLRGLRGS